jgi:hypothetical protein
MRGRLIRGVVLMVLCGATLSGCLLYQRITPRLMEPSVTLLRPVPWETVGEAEAQVSQFSLFWVATVTAPPDLSAALRQMVAEKGGDDVINIRMWHRKRHLILGTVDVFHVRGTVIRYTE